MRARSTPQDDLSVLVHAQRPRHHRFDSHPRKEPTSGLTSPLRRLLLALIQRSAP